MRAAMQASQCNRACADVGVWLHGEAVSAGMVMAADMSVRLGWIEEDILHRTVALLEKGELPTRPPKVMPFSPQLASKLIPILCHANHHLPAWLNRLKYSVRRICEQADGISMPKLSAVRAPKLPCDQLSPFLRSCHYAKSLTMQRRVTAQAYIIFHFKASGAGRQAAYS